MIKGSIFYKEGGYEMLIMIGRLKFIHLSLVLLMLRLLLESWGDIHHQIFIKVWQIWSKQEVKHYMLISTNVWTVYGINGQFVPKGQMALARKEYVNEFLICLHILQHEKVFIKILRKVAYVSKLALRALHHRP